MTPPFSSEAPWRLSEEVALRDEPFGALAYHFGNRRLVFLKSPRLVELVRRLDEFDSAEGALLAVIGGGAVPRYRAALASLAESGILSGR